MGSVSEQERQPKARRRRRRATSEVGPPPVRATDAARDDPRPQPKPTSGAPERPVNKARTDSGERGLHSLVGAGPSQLGVSGALRGRDVNRPTEDDLAEAERDVVIVRRHWKPPS
jgi:hypothetical protein